MGGEEGAERPKPTELIEIIGSIELMIYILSIELIEYVELI